MSRNIRQSAILNIVANRDIETQEELLFELKKQGFSVTQATISRDIKDLNLVKVPTTSNKYKYLQHSPNQSNNSIDCINLLKNLVVSVVSANNLIVVKTIDNASTLVSSIIEKLSYVGVLGVVGNGDCLLIVTIDNKTADNVANNLNKLIN